MNQKTFFAAAVAVAFFLQLIRKTGSLVIVHLPLTTQFEGLYILEVLVRLAGIRVLALVVLGVSPSVNHGRVTPAARTRRDAGFAGPEMRRRGRLGVYFLRCRISSHHDPSKQPAIFVRSRRGICESRGALRGQI